MMQVAIVSPPPLHCHQLEAPELDIAIDLAGHVRETCESTHQVPIGEFSALHELREGNLRAVEAFVLCVLNYRSNWVSGKTWRSSLRELCDLTGISIRYIREVLSELMDSGWVSYITKGVNFGSRYQLVHHNCGRDEVPTDKNGRALKFAVPQGKGGIFERLFAGDICWKSVVIWIMLKVYSCWKTGKTYSINIKTLSKWVRMSPQTVCDCLRELTQAGLLKRLTPKHEPGVYQLYPKPNGKPKPVYRPKRDKKSTDTRERAMRVDGDWRLSFNELWRVNVETTEIQTRKSRWSGIWRRPSGYEYYQVMPKSIQAAFDEAIFVHAELKAALGVTDGAAAVTDGAGAVTDSAQPHLFDVAGVNGSVGSA